MAPITSRKPQLAAAQKQHASDRAHQRRLARAVRSNDCGDLTFCGRDRYAVDDHDVAIASDNVLKLQ
jgi:hypothetical protein